MVEGGPGEQESDAALMQRLGAGDTAALGVLVRRHQERIRRLAYRQTHRWDVADDVAQEAFLRLWRSAPNYRPDAAFTTWLYRIVVNLCLDWARRPRLADMPAEMAAAASEAGDRAELAERVQRVVGALPERQRMVVLLHRFEGMTHGEIAGVTGWSESAVESLLVRAYARLREALRDTISPNSMQDFSR